MAESDAIRRQWFTAQPKPNVEAMDGEFGEWLESVRAVVLAHAPDYIADFESVQSVDFAPRARAVSYSGFSIPQDELINRFDARREKLLHILDGVRRG